MRCFFILLLATSSLAANFPAPVEGDFIARDVHFRSGESLPEVRIHYATIGTKRPGNAVLLLHGTGGSLHQFLNDHFAGVLFAPGGLLDAARFFIIIPDNIGHGQSTKPSDGLHEKFPRYDYDDMIGLQHRLVTEGLGIEHLFLVMGTSMGGMHTWMWGERWPQMMDGLLPLASAPAAIAGRNRVWRTMMMDDLRANDLTAAVQVLMLVTSAPLQWQSTLPSRHEADRWLAVQMKARLASIKPDDLLYALDASRDYDPAPHLDQIAAPLLAINTGDDFVNPPELGIVERLMPRVKRGRFVLIPAAQAGYGHGTHTRPLVWQGELAKFLPMVESYRENYH